MGQGLVFVAIKLSFGTELSMVCFPIIVIRIIHYKYNHHSIFFFRCANIYHYKYNNDRCSFLRCALLFFFSPKNNNDCLCVTTNYRTHYTTSRKIIAVENVAFVSRDFFFCASKKSNTHDKKAQIEFWTVPKVPRCCAVAAQMPPPIRGVSPPKHWQLWGKREHRSAPTPPVGLRKQTIRCFLARE